MSVRSYLLSLSLSLSHLKCLESTVLAGMIAIEDVIDFSLSSRHQKWLEEELPWQRRNYDYGQYALTDVRNVEYRM